MNITDFSALIKNVKKSGNEFYGACPACEANEPKGHHLYFHQDGNKILLNCKRGCDYKEICEALGIKTSDLFMTTKETQQKKQFLREHMYHDLQGRVVAKKQVYRLPNGKKDVYWSRQIGNRWEYGLKGYIPPLYCLPAVVKEQDTIYIAEGEKDAETLQKMGFTATTSPNGAKEKGKSWNTSYNQYLAGKSIVVLQDNDTAGRNHANYTATALLNDAKSVKLIDPCDILPALPEKGDISDVVAALGLNTTKKKLLELVEQATEYTEPQPDSKRPVGRPRLDNETAGDSKEMLNLDTFIEYLKERCIEVKYNVLTRNIDLFGYESKSPQECQFFNFRTDMFDQLRQTYKGVTIQTISDFIVRAANENHYNPVLELLQSLKWDGTSRLPEVYAILGLPDGDTLSRTLIHKWLLQCVAMLYNGTDQNREPWQPEGVLVLQSEQQGIGKTTFFRTLAMKQSWFIDGAVINSNDKDTTRRIITKWIAELGEIEATMKSDVEKLKGFITRAFDEYRLPYGREDVKAPRRTSMCGTCNSTEYLVDTTGNRRFWTVQVFSIDLDRLEKLDIQQLWAEIFTEVTAAPDISKCFALDRNSRIELDNRNQEHEKELKGEREVVDVLTMCSNMNDPFVQWQLVTVTQFKDNHPQLNKYTSAQIGKVLAKLGYKSHWKTIGNSRGKCFKLPLDKRNNFL